MNRDNEFARRTPPSQAKPFGPEGRFLAKRTLRAKLALRVSELLFRPVPGAMNKNRQVDGWLGFSILSA
jgi:hypothetical protein